MWTLSVLIPVVLASVLALVNQYAPLSFPPPYDDRIIEMDGQLGRPSPLKAPFHPNEILKNGDNLFENKIKEPETIVFDQDGAMYLFSLEGIFKAEPQGQVRFKDPVLFVEIKNGRPLSGAFDADGNLFFCDSILGLGKVNVTDRSYQILITFEKLSFCDDLVVASNGDVYFTDATNFRAFAPEEELKRSLVSLTNGGAFGRLLKYVPSTRDLIVLADNITFANGLTLAHDESYVLFTDSYRFQIKRYWLTGPKQGKIEEQWLQQNLPGYGDGISQGSNFTYWIAIFAPLDFKQYVLLSFRLTKWILFRIPRPILERIITPHGILVQADANGKVLRSFHDPSGNFGRTTSAVERNGKLYVGSFNSAVRVLDLSTVPA